MLIDLLRSRLWDHLMRG